MAAAKLQRPFFDLDDEIERTAGRTIAEIFATSGETHFRQLECDATAALANPGGAILALGGGWMANPGALALLRPPGSIIYLRVDVATAIRRMGASKAVRPLLSGPDPKVILSRLLAEREPFYDLADSVVETEGVAIEKVTDRVALVATRFWGG